jgi:tol-pal system protein YbgF
MQRAFVILVLTFLAGAPASAQTAEEVGSMRLYIQQLEERVRQLTGQNEQLMHELNQARTALGQPPLQATPPVQTGALTPQPLPGAAIVPPGQAPAGPGAPPADLGTLSVSPGDPLVAPDGALDGAPVDLSALAGGAAPELVDPNLQPGAPAPAPADQLAAIPGTPAPTTALTGSARDEYDLAYGYVLTGDYGLAEESFRNWLASFPSDPQAADAQFWLGESHLQQGEYREAASAFLALYNSAPDSQKGPDALLRLGTSLSALGEQNTACATFAEIGRKYPNAPESLMSRVRDEAGKAGCSG